MSKKCVENKIPPSDRYKQGRIQDLYDIFFKGKSLSKIRVKRKLSKNIVKKKKKNSMNYEDDEYS